MSGFKSKKVLTILAWVLVALLCFYVSYYVYPEKKPEKQVIESYPHTLSIYTAEGDTLLELDTRSEYVKIWIEDSCGVDVWTINEEGGWTRK